MVPVTSTITLTDAVVSKSAPLVSSKKRVQSLFFPSNYLSERKPSEESMTMMRPIERSSSSFYTTAVPHSSAPLNKSQGIWRPLPPLSPILTRQTSVQAWLENDMEELDLPEPMALDSADDSGFSSCSSPAVMSKKARIGSFDLPYNVRQSQVQTIAAKPSKYAFFTRSAYHQFSVQSSSQTSFNNSHQL
ncbi:hypothetical protein BDF22DRAFT_776340 [Syncephalis plumigaleata]|nr:hypothetical protein BDF22DRAFT_776340 [Syncephalis plumigaleata]